MKITIEVDTTVDGPLEVALAKFLPRLKEQADVAVAKQRAAETLLQEAAKIEVYADDPSRLVQKVVQTLESKKRDRKPKQDAAEPVYAAETAAAAAEVGGLPAQAGTTTKDVLVWMVEHGGATDVEQLVDTALKHKDHPAFNKLPDIPARVRKLAELLNLFNAAPTL